MDVKAQAQLVAFVRYMAFRNAAGDGRSCLHHHYLRIILAMALKPSGFRRRPFRRRLIGGDGLEAHRSRRVDERVQLMVIGIDQARLSLKRHLTRRRAVRASQRWAERLLIAARLW